LEQFVEIGGQQGSCKYVHGCLRMIVAEEEQAAKHKTRHQTSLNGWWRYPEKNEETANI